MLIVAVVSRWPGRIGVAASSAARSAYGNGCAAPLSTIAVISPSERPAAFASASALRRAEATALASACRGSCAAIDAAERDALLSPEAFLRWLEAQGDETEKPD